MSFVERTREETLVEHLLRNSASLALSQDQVGRLSRAYQLQQGTRSQQNEAGQIASEVRGELAAAAGQAVEAARDRGEKVTKFNDAGAMRIKGRDGLSTLRDSGSLSDDQAEAGLAYRYCVEFASAGLKSALDYRVGAEVVRGQIGLRSAAALHRAYVMARLAQFERAVAAIAKGDVRPLLVLRHVAGQGVTINAISTGGHARALNLAALRQALDEITIARQIKPILRITGD